MLHYSWNNKVEAIDSKGYFIEDPSQAYELLHRGMYSAEVNVIHRMIAEYSNPDKVFIDIGAHLGTYSWLLAPHFKHVYSFEPNKEIYNYLCANIALKRLSDKIDTFCIGLSNTHDFLPYFVRTIDGGGNGFEVTPDSHTDVRTLEVRPLDSFNIPDNVGLIKIDVEGHEKSVIEGSLKLLAKSNYPPILFESWAKGEHKQFTDDFVDNLRRELFETINNLGYKIHLIEKEIFIAIKD